MNFVFSPKNKVIIVIPTVSVINMSERNQLDRLTLLQDAAHSRIFQQVILNRSFRGIADVLVRKTLYRINQEVFIYKERFPRHLLKLLQREFRHPVGYKLKHLVFPCNCELYEMHKVPVTITRKTAFVALSMTRNTPFSPSSVAGCTPSVATVTRAMTEHTASQPLSSAVGTPHFAITMTPVTRLYE